METIIDYLQNRISTEEFFNILYTNEDLEKELSEAGIYMFLIEGNMKDKDFIYAAKQMLNSYRRESKFFYDSEKGEQLEIAKRYHNRCIVEIDKELDFHFTNTDDENRIAEEGICYLFKQQTEYHYEKENISLHEAECYINDYIKTLSDDTIDDICKMACEWKDEVIEDYPDVEYPAGLSLAQGRDILLFIELVSIHIYRNPYNQNDPIFSASFYCIPAWDEDEHMEILIKGNEVFDVREYLGYGKFAFWDKKDYQ